MLKRVISIIISAVMLCGLLSFNVNADAPLYFDGIKTNVFEQDFGEISSAAEASDFAFDGSWIYTGEFVTINGRGTGEIKTKNQIDLTDAYGYEFSTKAIMTDNNISLYLAYDEANSKGYRLKLKYDGENVGTLYLYRAGETDPVKEESVGMDYAKPHTWKVTYEDNPDTEVGGKVLTVTNSSGTAALLEYVDTEEASLKGTFGIANGSTNNLAVVNMKLEKLGKGTTVNNWRYEKTISEKDTEEALAADGLTFKTKNNITPTYSTANGIYFASNPSTTNLYYNKELRGDYTIETSYYTNNSNPTRLMFNGSGYENCFAVVYDINSNNSTYLTYSIRKYTNGTGTILPIVPDEETTEEGTTEDNKAIASFGTKYNTVTHVLKFKDNSDETITVTANAYGGQTTSTLLATVSATIKKSDLYTQDYNKFRIYWNAPGTSKIYKFNAYSTPSEETKTKDIGVLLDKTFETGDTAESLAELGITYDAEPVAITTQTDSLGAYRNGSEVSDGMRWGATSSTVTYADTLSGDYTIEATTRTYQNSTKFYINSTGTKRYEVLANSSKGIVYIYDGPSSSSSNLQSTSAALSSNFKGYGCKTTINVKTNRNGSVTIKATITPKGGSKSVSCTYTDTSSPYTSGQLQIYADKNTTYHTIYDMKITQQETYLLDGEHYGVFYIDGEEASSYSKGEIFFEIPVVDLGTYTVVAALYEDNEMTQMKTFTPREMYEGKVRLFDTTDSEALNSEVKVYLLDSISTLNKTMSVWTLK